MKRPYTLTASVYLHPSTGCMEYVMLQKFTNYIDAHIMKGRLESEGIQCWLEGEHFSALIVDPVLTNAFAGIKLMVPKDQVEQALEVLNRPPGNDGRVNEV